MDRACHTPLIALLVVALQSSFPRLAHADGALKPRIALVADHTDDPMLGVRGTHAVQPSEMPAPLVPRECKPRYMVGPGLGVPLGVGAVMGGAVMVAVGNFQVLGPVPKTRRDRAFIAGGSLMIGAGIATFIYSTIKLQENRHARRRVCGGTAVSLDRERFRIAPHTTLHRRP